MVKIQKLYYAGMNSDDKFNVVIAFEISALLFYSPPAPPPLGVDAKNDR